MRTKGYRHTEETKAKMRATWQAKFANGYSKKHTPEVIAKIKEAIAKKRLTTNGAWGRPKGLKDSAPRKKRERNSAEAIAKQIETRKNKGSNNV